MILSLKRAGWLFGVLALMTAWTAQADLILVNRGKSRYKIVIPVAATLAERHAAEELQLYLQRMSGARLPIVSDTEPAAFREILLGDNLHLRRIRRKIDLEKLGPDGFVLRTEHNQLIIAGGRPRGTLNGVYTLLEEKLGVRWFTPELEQVPRESRVTLPSLDETRIPPLENRDVFWREMMRDPESASRHHLNGQHYGLGEKQGGPFTTYYPFVHSLDTLVPRSLYHDHPEYFPLIKGQRKDGYVQRCLSNPDVLKIAIQNVRQWIQQHPEANIISVSQNDTINNCQCEACQAIDRAEGSPAGSLLRFVNAVAENIEKDYPNVRLDTLAYQYTRKPPKTVRPRPNVIIRLCSIECCFAHPLETCSSEANRRFRDDILNWQPVAPLLYVWDYTPNFAHYEQPFPNFDALQANVRFFVHHAVKGLFEQGNYSSGGQGEMGPLRAYVLAELLWNPDTDVNRHINDFVRAYYGQAASLIKAYLDLEQAQVRGKDCHAHVFDKSTACYLNDEFLQKGDALLAQAEQAAESQTVRQRVQVARLPIWYVQIATNRAQGSARTERIAHFLAVARQAGISNISESTTLDAWAKKVGAE
jgi:hypothetical protein